MTTQDIIDHLKAGRPLTKNVAKKIVMELERVNALEMGVNRRGGTICGERRFSEALYNDLRANLAVSEARVKALEEALRAIADGRGMVPDKSTIYMNGRTPEVPAIFNKHDMQEIAKIVLEATCQSI